jgi:hypothetical protein
MAPACWEPAAKASLPAKKQSKVIAAAKLNQPLMLFRRRKTGLVACTVEAASRANQEVCNVTRHIQHAHRAALQAA